MSDKNIGKIVQVIGPVIDVEFGSEELPEIYTALTLDQGEGENHIKLTAEVQQHLGRNQVRAVAMSSTDGVVRGMEVVNTGAPISVPVGEQTLGRIFNLLGEPIDNAGPVETKEPRRGPHRPPRPPLGCPPGGEGCRRARARARSATRSSVVSSEEMTRMLKALFGQMTGRGLF